MQRTDRFIAIAALAMVAVATLFATEFARAERAQTLDAWQRRLDSIATQRAATVTDWIGQQRQALEALANNPSLRLYAEHAQEPQEKTYLRHLLTFSADKLGYAATLPARTQLPADIPYQAESGIALIDDEGLPIAATPAFHPPVQAVLADGFAGIFPHARGARVLGFSLPVAGLEDEEPIARLVALRPADIALAPLLSLPAGSEEGLSLRLVERNGAVIDAAQSVASAPPDTLSAQQSIVGAPWRLQVFLPKARALALWHMQVNTMFLMLLLAVMTIGIALYAGLAWRNGSAAARLQRTAKRARMQQQMLARLSDALISVVDTRDSYASRHSERVAALSEEMARRMGLSPVLRQTARTAGSLLNIGKLQVPPHMLMQHGSLDGSEKERIRSALSHSAEIVKHVEFTGPVVETLRQAQEHWDGSGKLGIKGENIIVTARIVAAANAYVGMASSRAWRKALTPRQAVDALLAASGTQYDRKIVLALADCVEEAPLSAAS